VGFLQLKAEERMVALDTGRNNIGVTAVTIAEEVGKKEKVYTSNRCCEVANLLKKGI